ncbi:hypothetical protein [Arthrobacter psychrolactophilus]
MVWLVPQTHRRGGRRGSARAVGDPELEGPGDGAITVNIFLFNRLWKFGEADFTVAAGGSGAWRYSAPWLPFLPGKLRPAA